MTLDQADENFRDWPSATSAAVLLRTAAEYFRDEMIEPGTFFDFLERVASYLDQLKLVGR